MPDTAHRVIRPWFHRICRTRFSGPTGARPRTASLGAGRPGRWSRPLCFNVSQGYWVHLTKVTEAGVVSRHRHPAPVHGFVLEGRWRYLERDWVATAGSYLYEPPGDVHTLVVDPGDSMVTLFHNTGALLYCDEDGQVTGTTDVFDRIAVARRHFEEVGLGGDT